MRFILGMTAALLGAACTPSPEPPVPEIPHPLPRAKLAAAPALTRTEPMAARPEKPAAAPRATRREISGILFEGVAFDSRTHRLTVADQPGGPGSRWPDAASAARSQGGLAAVNAGFFTPEGKPLGLVISGGKRSGHWNGASFLGSGVWHEKPNGTSAISRRETLGPQAAGGMRELLQSGPMLVHQGRATGGLDADKQAVRIVLLWDGGSRWWIGRGSACTLAALARALTSEGPAGWKPAHALNLDGGRSADLWISPGIDGGPVQRRSPWNRPVRNFLILNKI